LGSLIAYLKQIPAVDAEYPTTRYGLFAPLAPAVGLYTPAAELIDHGALRPADPAQGATIEYGQYLFAVCAECHSTRLAGKLAEWTQTDFDRALQTRALPDGKKQLPVSHLKTYGEMTDTELSALWLYLQSIQTQKTNKDAK
jgi:mono/diheme cytochrome c family protein